MLAKRAAIIRVRGYGLSIVLTPSPAARSARRPLPMGEVKTAARGKRTFPSHRPTTLSNCERLFAESFAWVVCCGARCLWSPPMKTSRVTAALLFVAPLAALVVLWAAIVWAFDVNQRIFPSVPAVWNAALEALRDGTLIQHIGASLGRIAVGTVLAILRRGAARHRDGRQQDRRRLPQPAAALLLGARRHRLDPDRDAVVRLRLRRHHVRDLQRGVLRRHLQHAARRLDHSAAHPPRGLLARRRAAGRC